MKSKRRFLHVQSNNLILLSSQMILHHTNIFQLRSFNCPPAIAFSNSVTSPIQFFCESDNELLKHARKKKHYENESKSTVALASARNNTAAKDTE